MKQIFFLTLFLFSLAATAQQARYTTGIIEFKPRATPANVAGKAQLFYRDSDDLLCVKNPDGTVTCFAAIGDSSLWQRNGTDIFPKDSTWNVGIGTATPRFKLHVATNNANGFYAKARVIPGKRAWISVSDSINPFAGFNIFGSGMFYSRNNNTEIFFSKVSNDSIVVPGEETAAMGYVNLVTEAETFLECHDDHIHASVLTTDIGDTVEYVGWKLSDPVGLEIFGKDSSSSNYSVLVRKGNAGEAAGSLSLGVRNDGQITITDLASSAQKLVTALADGTLSVDTGNLSIFYDTVRMTSGEILANDTVILIDSVAGKYIYPINIIARFNYGSIPYAAGSGTPGISIGEGARLQNVTLNWLKQSVNSTINIQPSTGGGSSQLIENKSLEWNWGGVPLTDGDGTVDFFIWYKLIDLD